MSDIKQKSVGEDQSYTWVRRGDRKPWVEVTYVFYGPAWEHFAVMLARNGVDLFRLSTFIGAKIDPAKKVVWIRGSFTHEHWINVYAEKLKDWSFKKKGERVKIPQSSKEFDELTYEINGRPAQDIWDESFVSMNSDDEE